MTMDVPDHRLHFTPPQTKAIVLLFYGLPGYQVCYVNNPGVNIYPFRNVAGESRVWVRGPEDETCYSWGRNAGARVFCLNTAINFVLTGWGDRKCPWVVPEPSEGTKTIKKEIETCNRDGCRQRGQDGSNLFNKLSKYMCRCCTCVCVWREGWER